MLRQVVTIEEMSRNQDSLPFLRESIETLQAEINRLQSTLDPIQARYNQIQMELFTRYINDITNHRVTHEKTLAQLTSRLQKKEEAITTANGLITQLETIIESIERKIARIETLTKQNNDIQTPYLAFPASLPPPAPYYGPPLISSNHVHVGFVPHGDHYHKTTYIHPNPFIQRVPVQPIYGVGGSYQLTVLNNNLEITELQNSLIVFNPVLNRTSNLAELRGTLVSQQNITAQLVTGKETLIRQSHNHPLKKEKVYRSQLIDLQQSNKADPTLSIVLTENLENEAAQLDTQIQALTQNIQTNASTKTSYEQTLGDHENNWLIKNPIDLAIKLANDMKAKFQEFEINHPTNQSRYVRRCLLSVVPKIEAFLNNLVNNQNLIAGQTTYYQLYGMIISFKKYVTGETFNNATNRTKYLAVIDAFNKMLNELQQSASIHVQRPLFIVDEECLQKYNQLVNSKDYHIFHEPSIQILLEQELIAYTGAIDQLKATHASLDYNSNSTICLGTMHVITEAETAMASLAPEQREKHYKFFTTVLNKVNFAVRISTIEKENHAKAERDVALKDLATLIKFNTFGTPSFYQKFLGAALMVVGTLLTTLSVSAKFLTLGITIPASIAGIAAGSTLFLCGAGLFKNGMRKGLSKALLNLHTEIEKLGELPPPYHAGIRVS